MSSGNTQRMADAMTNLTEAGGSRPTGMRQGKPKSWRRLAAVAVLLCVAASAKVMDNPAVKRPVAHFIHFYQQTDNVGWVDRVVYSVLMTKAISLESTEPSS